MIKPEQFLELLRKEGISFFCGVPDSLLRDLSACIDDNVEEPFHIITANEGNAVALASGYHLASGKTGCVYLQNSGIGNIINPVTSLADAEVYQIPLLLIIGWRGEPGLKDEPQHAKQGKITELQLGILDIPYKILHAQSKLPDIISWLCGELRIRKSPVALLVRSNSFSEYKSKNRLIQNTGMRREEVLDLLLDFIKADDIVITTTGKTSREIYELRSKRGEAQRDFLTVGSMGHVSSIALGLSIARPSKRVICIDGDGSLLMHLGAMAIIGNVKPRNLIHLVLNNSAHDSVGGQPTVAGEMNLLKISEACGYPKYIFSSDRKSIISGWNDLDPLIGPVFWEVKIIKGSRPDLGRPLTTPLQNKEDFMEHITHTR